MTRGGGKEASDKRSGIGARREATGDGATGRSVETFQFGETGNA